MGVNDVRTEIDDATVHEAKESSLNEVNKKHFLKLIHDELKSIIGQKKYVKKALSKKNLENWERKEFNAIWPKLVKREKELMPAAEVKPAGCTNHAAQDTL